VQLPEPVVFVTVSVYVVVLVGVTERESAKFTWPMLGASEADVALMLVHVSVDGLPALTVAGLAEMEHVGKNELVTVTLAVYFTVFELPLAERV
jgi:hypothetical protein